MKLKWRCSFCLQIDSILSIRSQRPIIKHGFIIDSFLEVKTCLATIWRQEKNACCKCLTSDVFAMAWRQRKMAALIFIFPSSYPTKADFQPTVLGILITFHFYSDIISRTTLISKFVCIWLLEAKTKRKICKSVEGG